MLHILLLILKIIGIILLSVLGILILTILSLLFVPVRYRIEAVRKEGEGEPPVTVQVKMTWLFHFVNALIRYAGETQARIRVLILTIYRYPKREKAAKRQKRRRKKKERKRADRDKDVERAHKKANGEKQEGTAETEDNTSSGSIVQGVDAQKAKAEDAVADSAETAARPEDGEEAAPHRQSIFDRIRAFWEKILAFLRQVKEFFTNIQYTIRHFCDKIKSVWNDMAFRYEVLTSERFQEAWGLCQKELGKVFRSLKPKKLEADIVVGTDDPATTGEILAVCGMLYPFFGGHVNVSGDFEQKRLEGRFFMKGKVSSFVLLRGGWKLYRNQNLKEVYRLLKEGGSVNG